MDENQTDGHVKDVWASGLAYEPYVGRWSRLVAREFLEWLAVAPGGRWLDVGSGTGALSATILELASPVAVTGVDAAEGFVTHANQTITDARATFQQGDAQSLPVDSAVYDAVVAGFVLNFVPNMERMVRDMTRAARPGGVIAAYVWDYAGRMQFMRHFWIAAAALAPAGEVMDEGHRFPICHPEPLADLFRGVGLTEVEVRPIDIWTVFQDFDDFWRPFLGGQGAAPAYAMSLPEAERGRLRERIRASLPFAVDGSIPLMARAWAVRGTRPTADA